MNSLDPWRVILTDPADEVIFPAPYYGHGLYQEVPSWIHYGDGGSTHRLLFDGAFIGAETATPTPPLLPTGAQVPGGISVRKELDDKQVLHVEICVDGKCYRSSMDLAPAIALIMRKLGRWHEGAHAQMRAQVTAPTVTRAVDAAVSEAARAVVGALVGCRAPDQAWHPTGGPDVAVSGFWDSVKDAVLTVTLTKQTNQFIKDNKLEPYVKLASQAVATYYGGPAAGAAAGALSGPVMSLGVDDKQEAAAAAQDVQGVKTMAQQRDPGLGQAADIAQAAIEKTATTYHVAQIVKDAKAGNVAAQKSLANLNAAAARGDINAALALKLAAVIDREQRKTASPAVGAWHEIASVVLGVEIGCCPEVVSGWYDIVGAALS